MKVIIDQHKCTGAGQCVLAAPGVFDQGEEDGLVILLMENPPAELHKSAREAAHACPSLAITIED